MIFSSFNIDKIIFFHTFWQYNADTDEALPPKLLFLIIIIIFHKLGADSVQEFKRLYIYIESEKICKPSPLTSWAPEPVPQFEVNISTRLQRHKRHKVTTKSYTQKHTKLLHRDIN